MGYEMYLRECVFTIEHKNFAKAVIAIQKLHGRETCDTHFSWVGSEFHKINNLCDMLREWRWEPKQDWPEGDIIGLEFGGEKLGDDFLLFKTIAKYVAPDSFIEMQGGDGDRWKWVFDGKKCTEIQGRTVYDDGPAVVPMHKRK